jgi:hypothetical protein
MGTGRGSEPGKRSSSEPNQMGLSGLRVFHAERKALSMSDERNVKTVEVKVDKGRKTEASVGTGKVTGKATADTLEEAVDEAEARSKKGR